MVTSIGSIGLTVMPVAHHHFDLSSVEFRDALALRYHRPLLNMPAFCDGCGCYTQQYTGVFTVL